MGDLSEFFSRKEFACTCGCGFNTVDAGLLNVLIKVRNHFGRELTVVSACRCATKNGAVGSSSNSWHLKGRAADVKVRGIDPQLVAEAAAQYGATGIKTYEECTHIDTRNGKLRYAKT